jgi:RNA polymerase sigma-70 factor (ECF subfamily)
VGKGLQARVSESDIVQQSCASAVRNIREFIGSEPAEFEAWIKVIHERNLQATVRDHVGYQKRDVRQEEPVAFDSSGPQARTASPSHVAISRERQVLVLQAIEQLPEGQREAVKLRHIEGRSLAEIAAALDRSPMAIAGLLKRGLATLRDTLKDLAER